MGKAGKRDHALYATPERARKFREGIIEARETGSSGNIVITGQRELQECALDTLYRGGGLGSGETARWRYNAGFWLRELYLETHPSEGVAAYSIRTEATGEMPDQMAYNLKCLQDTAKALQLYWPVLEPLCCFDFMPRPQAAVGFSLDRLRDLRDGYIPEYIPA